MTKRWLNNMRNGHHHNSMYWQKVRFNLPALSRVLKEVTIAMVLSDAGMEWRGRDALIKFEQGHRQKDFVYHLFDLYKEYCFSTEVRQYLVKSGPRKGLIKSYYFKTFSIPQFTEVYNLFYEKGTKVIRPGLVLDHIGSLGLRYWIMSDGSLQKDKRSIILHTQSFTKEENLLLSSELNTKFGLHSRVIDHKGKYAVIFIPRRDAQIVRKLIYPHVLPHFTYKLPRKT